MCGGDGRIEKYRVTKCQTCKGGSGILGGGFAGLEKWATRPGLPVENFSENSHMQLYSH